MPVRGLHARAASREFLSPWTGFGSHRAIPGAISTALSRNRQAGIHDRAEAAGDGANRHVFGDFPVGAQRLGMADHRWFASIRSRLYTANMVWLGKSKAKAAFTGHAPRQAR